MTRAGRSDMFPLTTRYGPLSTSHPDRTGTADVLNELKRNSMTLGTDVVDGDHELASHDVALDSSEPPSPIQARSDDNHTCHKKGTPC